jgi:hypothetical protein
VVPALHAWLETQRRIAGEHGVPASAELH